MLEKWVTTDVSWHPRPISANGFHRLSAQPRLQQKPEKRMGYPQTLKVNGSPPNPTCKQFKRGTYQVKPILPGRGGTQEEHFPAGNPGPVGKNRPFVVRTSVCYISQRPICKGSVVIRDTFWKGILGNQPFPYLNASLLPWSGQPHQPSPLSMLPKAQSNRTKTLGNTFSYYDNFFPDIFP